MTTIRRPANVVLEGGCRLRTMLCLQRLSSFAIDPQEQELAKVYLSVFKSQSQTPLL